MDPILIPTANTIISEPIKLIISTWLKPKLDEFLKRKKIDRALFDDLTNLFSEYLNRTYKQQSSINILALELQQVELEQVYIPLRVYSDEKDEKITINDINLKFIKKYRKVVIEDTAGMGKSTLMKKLFISSIKQNINIPIFIELRYLSADRDIIDEIFENINPINKEFDKDIIRELVARGDFTFFLDGFDEIAFSYKEKVIAGLLKFIAKADNNFFFLTSRHDDALSSFGQFQKFKIESLKPEESYALLENYDSVTKLEIAPKAIQQIKDNIYGGSFKDLESFLGNPLLVSLLYLTFKYKQDIPSSKVDFFRKVYDALYDSHDLTKAGFNRFKYSNLSSGELQKVLMRLSFLCLKENENYYSKDKVLKLIKDAKSIYYKEIKEEDILKDLIETVPLFTFEGLEYRWAHKSFMEYFSALFIDDQLEKETILLNVFNSDNFYIYYNMLDLYYDINRYIFDKVFVYPILKNFVSIIENNIFEKNDFTQIEYYEKLYNKAYFLCCKRKSNDYKTEVNKLRKKVIPQLSHYEQSTSHRFDLESVFIYIRTYIKSYKMFTIQAIINSRKNNIIKISQSKDPFLTLIDTLRDNYKYIDCLEELVSFELKEKIDNVKLRERNLILGYCFSQTESFYFDYYETLKYISIIEEEIKRREENIFTNL